eukprot:TRINITY_DN199_c0_g4_i1.p1 TRINITY_DN199_c0_g4~~TRINITY_DN199_c0_g4_i1.p1  ORF type:complete len:395 (-),score=54.43 TRINITY_DN199_c0_g4_i1:815-1999(-)
MASAEADDSVTLVGFVRYESEWSAASSSTTSLHPLPGDVIIQVGVTGASNTMLAPFEGGLLGVVKELQRRLENQNIGVEITIRRNTTNMSMFLPLASFRKKKNAKDIGTLAGCQLQEGTTWMFESLACSLRQSTMVAALRELSEAKIGRQKLPELPANVVDVFSVMVFPLPNSGTGRYHDVEHTGKRAINWVAQAQASGVAMNLVSMGAEVVPLSKGDLRSKMQKHGSDSQWGVKGTVECVRGVRLWLQPQNILKFVMQPTSPYEESWDMVISTTNQGFLFVQSVEEGGEADRCGLAELHRSVVSTSKLVIAAINKLPTLPTTLSNGHIIMADHSDVTKVITLHLRAQKQIEFEFIVAVGVPNATREPEPRNGAYVRGPGSEELLVGLLSPRFS